MTHTSLVFTHESTSFLFKIFTKDIINFNELALFIVLKTKLKCNYRTLLIPLRLPFPNAFHTSNRIPETYSARERYRLFVFSPDIHLKNPPHRNAHVELEGSDKTRWDLNRHSNNKTAIPTIACTEDWADQCRCKMVVDDYFISCPIFLHVKANIIFHVNITYISIVWCLFDESQGCILGIVF